MKIREKIREKTTTPEDPDRRPRAPRAIVVWGYDLFDVRHEIVCASADDARAMARQLRELGYARVGWKGAESPERPSRPVTDEDLGF